MNRCQNVCMLALPLLEKEACKTFCTFALRHGLLILSGMIFQSRFFVSFELAWRLCLFGVAVLFWLWNWIALAKFQIQAEVLERVHLLQRYWLTIAFSVIHVIPSSPAILSFTEVDSSAYSKPSYYAKQAQSSIKLLFSSVFSDKRFTFLPLQSSEKHISFYCRFDFFRQQGIVWNHRRYHFKLLLNISSYHQ